MVRWNPIDSKCIVTGASSGIGREVARTLALKGSEVWAVARREERLHELQQQVQRQASRGRIVPLAGDVTDASFRQRLIDAVTAVDSPRFSLLVNAAGIGALGPFMEADEARLRRVFELNFFATVELSRLALPSLCEVSGSVLCQIGSVLGHAAAPFKSEYSASKFALHGWSAALRAELVAAGSPTQVTIISPSTTATEFFDAAINAEQAGRFRSWGRMTAAKVAEIAVSAIQHRRPEVILSPGGKMLVWLNRLSPSLLRMFWKRFG